MLARPMTVDEAADYLQLSVETVRRMLRDGRLRGVQPAGRKGGWRIMPADLRAMVEGTPPALARQPRERRALDDQQRARAVARLRDQAERARARGDDEGAERFETIADGMDGGPA